MVARWDDTGTVIPAAEAKYTVAEQPIAEYDNWINYNLVTDIQAVIDDVINKFNANTILKADSDNTPAALVVAEQTMVGRKTGNSIAALTGAEVLTLIGVEAGATADQSNTEIRDAVEAAVDSNTFDNADHAKLNGIEAAADVTDATNVAAATAVMDADFSAAEGFMRKTGAGAYTTVKSNMGAAVAPTVDDDTGDGYGVGSSWFDTTADKAYVCLDNSSGAAVWRSSGGRLMMSSGGDVLATRALGVIYQNTNEEVMFVSLALSNNTGGHKDLTIFSDSATPPTVAISKSSAIDNVSSGVDFFVQPGNYYKVVCNVSIIYSWFEFY